MKKKNKSKIYKDGVRVQTRDEFLDDTTYFSPGHPNKNDLYRPTIIVASNSEDELVLSPLTTHLGKNKKGTISDYIYVSDNEGKPIVIDGIRFVVRKGKGISKEILDQYLKHLYKDGPRSKINRYLVRVYIKKRK